MRPTTAMDFERLLDRLSELYGTGDWRVPYLRDHAENPFQVLIGTILSQRTRDANTDRASLALFARFPDAPSIAGADVRVLESLVRGTGYYHTKARAIRACSQQILTRFGGIVPRTLDELLTLPNVGPKTANCVLVFGYGIPAIPVDTHVHRISNRLGLVRTRTPEDTETALRQAVPERYWIPLNPILVQHGQNLCRPRAPKCPECPIQDQCATGIALSAGLDPPRREDRPAPPRRGHRVARAVRRRSPPPRRPAGPGGRRRQRRTTRAAGAGKS
ncbi:MAG: endonuclease III [Thermoplasmata archaeon]|nr:endonuclease III [Thermoplasmata archaeon]